MVPLYPMMSSLTPAPLSHILWRISGGLLKDQQGLNPVWLLLGICAMV